MRFLSKDLYSNIYFWISIVIFVSFFSNIILFLISGFTKDVSVKKIFDLRGRRSSGLMFEDSDNNNYRVVNVWYLGRFNSVEEWNKLKIGKKYQIKGYGYRIGFLGMYPKVYDIQSI